MKLSRRGLFRVRTSALAVVLVGLVMGGTLYADSLVHGFSAKGSLQPGMVVALSDKTTVMAAPSNDPKKIYGVMVSPNEVPFTVSTQGRQIFVATNGNYPVLVSTQYGRIKSGDYLSLSSSDGIAAKVTPDKSLVLGKALEPFDGKGKVFTTVGGFGIGRILVNITPQRNPTAKSDAVIPGPLRKISESIAGSPVAALKIYLALGVLVVSAVIGGILVSVGVRSAITSIGRNPLSKKSIYRGLAQTVIMAILIFIIGLFGVYLLLKL